MNQFLETLLQTVDLYSEEGIEIPGYRWIAHGTSRHVWIDKHRTHIIKVCTNYSDNRNANLDEVEKIQEIGNDLWFLPKLLGYSTNYNFVAFEFCKKIRKISDLKFPCGRVPKTYREISDYIKSDAEKMGINILDICKRNLLERNGIPILCDFE